MTAALIWVIALAAIAGILLRPKGWPEALWACLGAFLLVVLRLIPLAGAAGAIAKGMDVYLFLTGMMLLAELARQEGVFDWIAGLAVLQSRGSPACLFGLVYVAGIVVTVFLSNDATAVVLTPAVYAAVKKAQVEARPYLFSCAFIANAASFVLPISNPANLVVYGKTLPPLVAWLRIFAWPALIAIAVTFLMLRWLSRSELGGTVAETSERPELSAAGLRASLGLAATALVLIAASARGIDLGLPTSLAAIIAVLVASRSPIKVARQVSWSVIPLVAGLFVLVEGINRAGAAGTLIACLKYLNGLPYWAGSLAASFGIAALSNAINNLPAGLLAGSILDSAPRLRNAVLIGVDLGPNLSVTGSLATILWLIALRREGHQVSAWEFLKMGAPVMIPALLAATVALSSSGI
jgi:arsenical pump membrane protein